MTEAPPRVAVLTINELCDRWGVSRWMLARMRREGQGPTFLVLESGSRRYVRYLLASVEEYERDKR